MEKKPRNYAWTAVDGRKIYPKDREIREELLQFVDVAGLGKVRQVELKCAKWMSNFLKNTQNQERLEELCGYLMASANELIKKTVTDFDGEFIIECEQFSVACYTYRAGKTTLGILMTEMLHPGEEPHGSVSPNYVKITA